MNQASKIKRLMIVGAGGFGRELESWARDALANGVEWKPVGFLDDDPKALNGKQSLLPLLGGVSDFVPAKDILLVIAVGRPDLRRRIQSDLLSRGARFANVIHPTASVARSARLGTGIILAQYSVVSAEALVGDGVFLNFHAVAQHDVVLGAWCQLNSHADVGGFSVLGEEVLVGTHGVIPAGARVPDRQIIQAGCVFDGANNA
jgi:sugar O-acyltransferase (sialic acid O-acetyltransferase NeuD family)